MPRTNGLFLPALIGVFAWMAPGSVAAGPEWQPAADEPVGLEIEVIDGHTGDAVDGVSVAFTATGGARHGELQPLEKRGGRFTLQDTGFVRGARASHEIKVDLPAGWVREKEPRDFSPPVVTLRTRRMFRRVVVWPEADIRVLVLHADGSPAEGASLVAERLGEKSTQRWTSTCAYSDSRRFPFVVRGITESNGWGRVAGVPAIPGARYRISANQVNGYAVSEGVTLRKSAECVTLEIQLTSEASGGSGSLRSRCLIACSPGLGPPTPGDGQVRVEVTWLNGDPARGVRVMLEGDGKVPLAKKGFYRSSGWRTWAFTDQDGVVLFEKVPVGTAEAYVWEPGFVRGAPATVEARAGKESMARLTESPGTGVIVQVLSRDGDPVPGAELTVRGEEPLYSPVDSDGMQQIEMMTGTGGLSFLPRVPSGGLRMRATLGTRNVDFTATGAQVKVVLPDE